MATVKKVKKAQNGAKKTVTEKSLRPQGIKNQYAEITSKGKLDDVPSTRIDTSARAKAIKEGKFREDPKTGDLFPVKKKAKSGAALKKQAAVAIAMKKAGKAPKKKMQYGGSAASMVPKKAMGGMRMMKGGGKCKYGC
jgi:hypothetical protein